jgi:hypothetical protein
MSNEFWEEFNRLLDRSEPEPIEYRLHYTETGAIYLGTMQQHPTDTTYLVVTKDEYDRYFDYQVVAGALKRIVHDAGYHVQLQKSNSGYKTVKGHAGLLLEDDEYPDIEYYEYRNY